MNQNRDMDQDQDKKRRKRSAGGRKSRSSSKTRSQDKAGSSRLIAKRGTATATGRVDEHERPAPPNAALGLRA